MHKDSRKATHYGTCQICGHVQKAPRGLMALHGYEVRWQHFSGTCHGSRQLPFEIDCTLAQSSLEQAVRMAEINEEEATAHLLGDRPLTVTYRRLGTTSSYELPVTGTTTDNWGTPVILVPEAEGAVAGLKDGRLPLRQLGVYSPYTETEVIDLLRGRRALEFTQRAAQYRSYCEWQRLRLTGWSPREMKPVAA